MSQVPVGEIFDPTILPEPILYEGRKVYIALPWYREAEPRTAFCIAALMDRKRTALGMDFGDAFIAHSRNKLADNFLKSNCEWMLTLDSDMVIPFGNAKLFNSFTGFNLPEKYAGLNTIDRLLSHGRSLVGGLYFGRWPGGKPVYAGGAESKQEEEFVRRGPHDLIQQTRWVGTGCLLIHRTVFTAIETKFPHLARKANGSGGNWFTSSEHDLSSAVSDAISFIETTDHELDPGDRLEKVYDILKEGRNKSRQFSGLGVGEDVQLCHRAAQAGHPAFVDLGLVCGHTGSYCYGAKKVL